MKRAGITDGQRRKRRSPEEIMERLVGAAGEVFRRSGYRGATTAAIARKAEVTEAQLFRYFDSKAELFRKAIFQPLSHSLADFNRQQLAQTNNRVPIREQERSFIADLQRFIAENSELFVALVVAETYAPDKTEGLGAVDSLNTYFELGAAAMQRRIGKDSKVSPELMVRVSFAAVLANAMFKDWLFPEGLSSDKAINDAIIDFVIDGISANSERD